MKKLIFFKDYLTGRYGKPLYRIPVDLALGCPNRDRELRGGCLFCAADGSRARHLARQLQLPEQVARGIAFARQRYRAEPPYIAYFQSFTNTYAPVEQLRSYYETVLAQADFRLVIIATRPDALPEPVLDYLAELNRRYEVWVELGVQSCHDRTLQLIRRGHDFAAVRLAAQRLAERQLRTAAHLILGLPQETPEMWSRSAELLAELPFQAVKLHQLMVLKNSPLAAWYGDPGRRTQLRLLNEYEYAAAAADFLRRQPEGRIVMRLTGDAASDALIAPKWWMSKGQFLEFFRREFARESPELFPKVATGDGSYTLYHPRYRQHFHSLAGARSEAEKKLIEAVNLPEQLQQGRSLRLLDIGFGLGVNAFTALAAAEQAGTGRLDIVSLENDRRVLAAALPLYPADSREGEILKALERRQYWQGRFAALHLLFGDARRQIRQLSGVFDLIFMDGFSPDVNPELWSYDFIRQLKTHLAADGRIVTYCSAYPLRGALHRAGLAVGETTPFGRRRGGTLAARRGPLPPLSDKEWNIILGSTAGVPYRDRGLAADADTILRRRELVVKRLRARGIPKRFQ